MLCHIEGKPPFSTLIDSKEPWKSPVLYKNNIDVENDVTQSCPGFEVNGYTQERY